MACMKTGDFIWDSERRLILERRNLLIKRVFGRSRISLEKLQFKQLGTGPSIVLHWRDIMTTVFGKVSYDIDRLEQEEIGAFMLWESNNRNSTQTGWKHDDIQELSDWQCQLWGNNPRSQTPEKKRSSASRCLLLVKPECESWDCPAIDWITLGNTERCVGAGLGFRFEGLCYLEKVKDHIFHMKFMQHNFLSTIRSPCIYIF